MMSLFPNVPPIPDCSDLLAIPSIKRRYKTAAGIAEAMIQAVRYWQILHPGRNWITIVPPQWRNYITYNL
jgi:hypothetical protein